ncbi:MAG: ribulose-phosphate 3-epimerase [Chlorobi bacterium]|nr:ribulose-phosphate 3-epimerase [Chlorobiota bacterium]
MSHLVAPSLLSADFLNLEREINMVNHSQADWIHLDIMDGVFVPNLTIGFPVLERIRDISRKPMDVHLMIVDPGRYIDRFAATGASILTVHYEACTHLNRTIHHIKSTGMKAGVALNPHSPVSLLEEVLSIVDMVLIMSVNPGFGAQKFIPSTYQKIRKLSEMRDKSPNPFQIEVDGGVNLQNAPKLIEAGVDVLVAGNTVFFSDSPEKTIRKLKNL